MLNCIRLEVVFLLVTLMVIFMQNQNVLRNLALQ